MTERQKTYAYTLAAIVAAIILWLLFFKRDNLVSVSDSNLPYNYFDGIPQMTATGIPSITMPTSHATSPNIVINNGSSNFNSGSGSCCGCGGNGDGGSNLTSFSNFLNSIVPSASLEWMKNMTPFKAPAITKATASSQTSSNPRFDAMLAAHEASWTNSITPKFNTGQSNTDQFSSSRHSNATPGW